MRVVVMEEFVAARFVSISKNLSELLVKRKNQGMWFWWLALAFLIGAVHKFTHGSGH
jgi:ABC-type nickel/cobalt efflux system permease component RcnA